MASSVLANQRDTVVVEHIILTILELLELEPMVAVTVDETD
jgi:hypothetical protein